MNQKPPVPEKSDRLRNLPVPSPRKGLPPPKPPPYNGNRDSQKKPDPAPRKISRQGNNDGALTNHQHGIDRNEVAMDTGRCGHSRDSPPLPAPRSNGHVPKSSPPTVHSRSIESRPRLDTPITLPDPDLVPQNGVTTPPVPLARSRVSKTSSRNRLPEVNNKKCDSPSQPKKELSSNNNSSAVLYTEAYATTTDKPSEDGAMYSTVVEGLRRVKAPPQSQTLMASHSGSVNSPAPHPRSNIAPPPIPSLPHANSPTSEYDVTTHAIRKNESFKSGSQRVPVPDPTPSDTYSMLARPDQPNKQLNPIPQDNIDHMYSSLDLEGVQQVIPSNKPAAKVCFKLYITFILYVHKRDTSN